MPSFNKVILMGNLTADPELKQTPSGVAVTSFSIAVERRFQNQDGQRDVDFINIVCWRKTAETVSKYFGKGCRRRNFIRRKKRRFRLGFLPEFGSHALLQYSQVRRLV